MLRARATYNHALPSFRALLSADFGLRSIAFTVKRIHHAGVDLDSRARVSYATTVQQDAIQTAMKFRRASLVSFFGWFVLFIGRCRWGRVNVEV